MRFGTRAVDDRITVPIEVLPVDVILLLFVNLVVSELEVGIAGFSWTFNVFDVFKFRLDLLIDLLAPAQKGIETVGREKADRCQQQGNDVQGDIKLPVDGKFGTCQFLDLGPEADRILAEKI